MGWIEAKGSEQWPEVRPSHSCSTTTSKKKTKLPKLPIYKSASLVPAPWCSQTAADLGAVIKFLSCKGIFDSLWHIKDNYTEFYSNIVVDPLFSLPAISVELRRKSGCNNTSSLITATHHSSRTDAGHGTELPGATHGFCTEILFLCLFYVFSHSMCVISGPPGFRRAIKRLTVSLRCQKEASCSVPTGPHIIRITNDS